MPELPEVETVRQGIIPAIEGAKIKKITLNRPDLRIAFPKNFARLLEGCTILHIKRRAKYLLLFTDKKLVLIIHLGMSGSLRVEKQNASEIPGRFHHPRAKNTRHDHVRIHFGDDVQLVYNDPRRFGFMDMVLETNLPSHSYFAQLGVEPLSNDFSAPYLYERINKRNSSIKSLLLNQKIIAGLGNIYVCEALWHARISPELMAKNLKQNECENLVTAIRNILHKAIQAGGSSLRDHSQADGRLGYFQHEFVVYNRENTPCIRQGCPGIIARITQAGRSSFFCPKCQKS